MLTATLRNVGGSVMVAIPKPVLEKLGLAADRKVDLSCDDGRLIVTPQFKPKYTLTSLLGQCDQSAPRADPAWEHMAPVGREEW